MSTTQADVVIANWYAEHVNQGGDIELSQWADSDPDAFLDELVAWAADSGNEVLPSQIRVQARAFHTYLQAGRR